RSSSPLRCNFFASIPTPPKLRFRRGFPERFHRTALSLCLRIILRIEAGSEISRVGASHFWLENALFADTFRKAVASARERLCIDRCALPRLLQRAAILKPAMVVEIA